MTANIQHLNDKKRFELIIDGLTSYIQYELKDGVMEIHHTVVPKELGGKGIAAQITEFALNTAKENTWKVKPICSYAVAYINKHPEHQDLTI